MYQTISIIFFILLITAGIRIYFLKKEIKAISKELETEQKEFCVIPAFNQKQIELKNKNKSKIMELFTNHTKITTGLISSTLGVSSVTAFRYLEELEQERKIKQNGKFGRFVYYSKIS